MDFDVDIWTRRLLPWTLFLLAVLLIADMASTEFSPPAEPVFVRATRPDSQPQLETAELVATLSHSAEELLADSSGPLEPGGAQVAPEPEIPMVLRGTLLGGGHMLALLEVEGDTRFYKKGDRLGPALILAVKSSHVEYEVHGQRKRLEMGATQTEALPATGLPQASQPSPALTLSVQVGHPLMAFGLQNGERVISVNGQPPTNQQQLMEACRDSQVAVEVERGGQPMLLWVGPLAEGEPPSPEPIPEQIPEQIPVAEPVMVPPPVSSSSAPPNPSPVSDDEADE